MSRRNETIWWCCVCVVVSALTGLIVYETTSHASQDQSTSAATPERRMAALPLRFEDAGRAESAVARQGHRLLAIAGVDEPELRRILEGYADGTFKDEAGFETPLHIIRHYARLNPESALSYVLNHEHWAKHSSLVFLEWAQTDLNAAIEALDQLGPLPRATAEQLILQAHKRAPLDEYVALQNRLASPNNDVAFSAWAFERVRADAQNGWSDVVRVDADYPDRGYAWTYASEWSVINAVNALNAFDELSQTAHETYGDAFRELMRSIAMNDPESALLWLESQPPDSQKQSFTPFVLSRLAEQDPLYALDRAAYLPGRLRARSEQMILRQWSHYQPEQAAQWLMTYGDPGSLQEVLPLLALAQRDSAQAQRIANLITNDETRNEILDQLDSS